MIGLNHQMNKDGKLATNIKPHSAAIMRKMSHTLTLPVLRGPLRNSVRGLTTAAGLTRGTQFPRVLVLTVKRKLPRNYTSQGFT